MIYRKLLRPLLFRLDAEWCHDQAINASACLQQVPAATRMLQRRYRYDDACLRTDVAGIRFENPVGLAAGFDKSARAVSGLATLGFGHLEVGSVSTSPSAGNTRPRLWRLPADDALCVHYGLPNDGARAVAARLGEVDVAVPVGINLVNTNRGVGGPASCEDEILEDYEQSAATLSSRADYLMLNLSCPNTADGRQFFSQRRHLEQLLGRIEQAARGVPLFLKIHPDMDEADLDELLTAADPFSSVRGFMFNLSPHRRDNLRTPKQVWQSWPGAISGKPTATWINDAIGSLYRRIDRGRHSIIAAGGVSSGNDAFEKICLGASLVQLYTALVYRGPGVVRSIKIELADRLRQEGFRNVSEAVGSGVEAFPAAVTGSGPSGSR